MACIRCHKKENAGLVVGWSRSRHANANITCYDCHKAEEFDPDVSQEHCKQYRLSDIEYGTKEYRVPASVMTAPDYAWRHGFYECKKRHNRFMEEARDLIEHETKACKATDFPNATGNKTRPPEIFPEEEK